MKKNLNNNLGENNEKNCKKHWNYHFSFFILHSLVNAGTVYSAFDVYCVRYRRCPYAWGNACLKRIIDRVILKARREYIKKVHSEWLDKCDCVIQPNHPSFGFFAHFINILGILRAEILQGNSPYIDMGTYPNCYLKEDEVGKENTWEWYFVQPCTRSMPKIGKLVSVDKNLFWNKGLTDGKLIRIVRNYHSYGNFQRPEDSCDFLTDARAVQWWRRFVKEYIVFNDATIVHIESVYGQLFRPEERVLGVLLRGTDFSDNRPRNHPIVPTVEAAIPEIREVFELQGYNRIFLVTEDETRNSFQMGLDYISAIALLGKCQGLMACRTSGAIAALLLSDGYEYTYFWNLGRYQTQEYNMNEWL